ncbi:MAG: hypothetical protein ACXWJO_03345, partial [Xanthobacteraceae bacterium]
LDLLLPHLLEARQVIDAGAADDAEHGLGHEAPYARNCDGVPAGREPAPATAPAGLSLDRRTGLSAWKRWPPRAECKPLG